MILKALHRRYAKRLLDFQEQRHSCQGAAAVRRQLEANGGLSTKEEIQQRMPRPFKEN